MNPNDSRLSLRELRTFCIVAERLSFREAAEQMFVTASAVSHQIKNLETEFGKKLFERGTRTISLTFDGELLYKDVVPLMRELEAVSKRHRAPASRSTLRISVQPFFASELFVPKLQKFRELHPDIDIAVDTSDESTEKHPATADASIRVFRAPPEDFVHAKLFPLRLVPAGSMEFYDSVKVRAGRIVSEFPVVVHESRSRAWHEWERASGIRLPRNLSVVTLDSMIAVATAAERGLGAALVPVQLSDARFRSGQLVPLFEHELETSDTYYFVYRKESGSDENIQRLQDWVLKEFADTA